VNVGGCNNKVAEGIHTPVLWRPVERRLLVVDWRYVTCLDLNQQPWHNSRNTWPGSDWLRCSTAVLGQHLVEQQQQ
jgi:hypothetical protein